MPLLRARRGSALILVLLMTLAVAALAIAAIFMSSSASLLSKYYDRDRQFAYAAEAGLQRVLSRLRTDTAFVVSWTNPGSPVLDLFEVKDASGTTVSGARVRIFAARTFDMSSTGPVTVSLLAQVVDASGTTRLARRLDVRQEAFSSYALAANSSTSAGPVGANIPYASGAQITGRVHVNGNWAAVAGTPTYRDSVFATGTIGGDASLFRVGKYENAALLAWPSAAAVRVADSTEAVAQGRYIVVNSNYPTRFEFVTRDDNSNGVIDRNEGYLRVFEFRHAETDRARTGRDSDEDATNEFYEWDRPFIQNQCGAFYRRNGKWMFFPVAAHRADWVRALIAAPGEPAAPTHTSWSSTNERRDATRAVLQQPTARCFPAGSPWLLHTESFTNPGGSPSPNPNHRVPWGMKDAAHRLGGTDTIVSRSVRTCTFNYSVGSGHECSGNTEELGVWRDFSGEVLIPLDRGAGAVVFADRSVSVHGTVAGRVKLYVRGTATIIDRIVHAGGTNAEATGCNHLFGLVARDSIIIDDNSVSARRRVGSGTNTGAPGTSGSNATWTVLGGEDSYTLHGSYFALTGTFAPAGAASRIGTASDQFACFAQNFAGGCLNLSGSVAAQVTSRFSTASGNGFRFVPSADACLEAGYRPPNYPLANRYRALRAVNVRPASIIGDDGIANYFATLQGISDIP